MKQKAPHIQAFIDAPRDNPARPRRVRCLNPFRWLEVGDAGHVTPCCAPWFKGHVGEMPGRTMAEIWNSPEMQAVREAMYEGGDWQKYCNAATCPHIQNDIWINIDQITADTRDVAPNLDAMLDQVREGATEMETGPTQIGLSCDPRCNLRCIMCSTLNNDRRDGAVLRMALSGIKDVLPTVRRLKLMGDGEVFAVPESREFLYNFDQSANPDVAFLIHTNGMLLTPRTWEKIAHLRLDWVVVSMDAASKFTYETIRRGGRWETLMENLRFLADRQHEGKIGELHVNMCVMRSNHREMADFARLAVDLGVSLAYYLPVMGDYGAEQIFETPDPACLARIAAQLRDPIMSNPLINTNALDAWRDWRPSMAQRVRSAGRTLKRYLKKQRTSR